MTMTLNDPRWRLVLDCFNPANMYRTFDMESYYWFMRREWDKPSYFTLSDKSIKHFDIAGLYYWDGGDLELYYNINSNTPKKENDIDYLRTSGWVVLALVLLGVSAVLSYLVYTELTGYLQNL
jgi:hypothetical protein